MVWMKIIGDRGGDLSLFCQVANGNIVSFAVILPQMDKKSETSPKLLFLNLFSSETFSVEGREEDKY